MSKRRRIDRVAYSMPRPDLAPTREQKVAEVIRRMDALAAEVTGAPPWDAEARRGRDVTLTPAQRAAVASIDAEEAR